MCSAARASCASPPSSASISVMESVIPTGNAPRDARSAATISWWATRSVAETASNRARSRTLGGKTPRR